VLETAKKKPKKRINLTPKSSASIVAPHRGQVILIVSPQVISMAYWWVNHKQTYLNEIEGGYVWSPKENSNGAKNQTYTNLTLTQKGDIVFSYAGGKIKALGIVASNYREQQKPTEFGKSGDSWANIGWAVPIDWEILSSPVTPKDHIAVIAPLLPEKNSPLQSNGNGNQSCYLASIQDELGNRPWTRSINGMWGGRTITV
jgi:putative restriction endonuclease